MIDLHGFCPEVIWGKAPLWTYAKIRLEELNKYARSYGEAECSSEAEEVGVKLFVAVGMTEAPIGNSAIFLEDDGGLNLVWHRQKRRVSVYVRASGLSCNTFLILEDNTVQEREFVAGPGWGREVAQWVIEKMMSVPEALDKVSH
jgi:hypothetical protein